MKKSICLLTVLLICFLFVPSLAEEKESYNISFYFNNYVHYPGDAIPIEVSLYYYYLKRTGDFNEDFTIKIYKIPTDLSNDKYEKYASQNKPVKELTRSVTMKYYGGNYWESYTNVDLPGLPSGNYYIVSSTSKAKYANQVRISKIGMSAKVTKDLLLLFVQDRKTGKSIENEEVNLYLPAGTKKFRTDKDGTVSVYLQDLKELKPGTACRVIAVSGEDSAEVNVSIPSEQAIFKGYIYTDRPVYRPEQKVNFKGILRMQKGDLLEFLSGEDIKVSIKDTQNGEVYKNTLKTDEYGSIFGDFTLTKEPPLGNYSITCTDPNGQQAVGTFQVQEYRKPDFEVKVNSDKEQYVQGDKMSFTMEAKYYFGAPVPDTEYRYEIYRTYYYPYYWYYWWEEECMPYYNPYNSYGGEMVSSGNGKTDKNGKASFTCEAAKVDYDANYNVVVKMVDQSRREVTGSTKTLITRGAFYLTLTPDRYFYEPGDKVQLKVSAKDYSEKPVETEVTLKIRYEYYTEKTKTWDWKEMDDVKIKTDKNGIAYHGFTPEKDGYYEINCSAADQNKNEIKSSGYVYCYSGTGYYDWYRLSNLTIIPDKNIYEVGEKAEIFIVCPYEGVKGLVTVEGDGVYTQKVIDFSNRAATLKVDITKEYTPDFYVTVSFYYQGVFYYQTKKIVCPSKDKFLTVSIESDKEKYKPRDTAKFTIKTLDKDNKPVTSQVTLGVADESVYAVVSESTPNIQKFFYGMRDNKTYTYSSDGNVYGGSYGYYPGDGMDKDGVYRQSDEKEKTETLSTGAPMKNDIATPLVQPDFTRSFFPDTAYFNPGIITDQNGTAEVMVPMPDTLTTWRATARSVSKNTDVGENTKKVIVSKDLLARLITPRFFTERDETVITGIVHNYLNSEKTVYAKLDIDGGIELLDSQQFKVQVPANGASTINWKVKVKRTGKCVIKLTALTDEESDALELTVPVLPHGTEKFVAVSGSTKDVAEEEITFPKEGEQGSAKCLIILDPSLASTVLSSLNYLIGYPYGCVEQTMSRFLPNVIVAKTLGELDIYDENINKELPKMVKEGFDRLYNFHHSDGGWGWWENDESHPYMTSYVVYGLTLAKDAGYSVDQSKIDAGIGWIRQHFDKEKNSSTRAYMAFAVTTAGGNCKDWLMSLYKEREKLDSYAKAVLALSLKKSGLNTEALEMVKLLESTADVSGTTASWSGLTGSHGWTDNKVETTAYCLSALLAVKPESQLIPKVVRYLAMSRNGDYWYSTKDTAAAVMALTGYIKTTREMNPEFTTDVYFNGTKIKTISFTKADVGKPGKQIEIPFDQGLLNGKNKVKFEMKGKGMLYYAVYLKYYTGEENVKGNNSGFKITRTYYLLKPGQSADDKDKVKLGSNGSIKVNSQDTILVQLDITGAQNYEYLIIEDPKPSGCEFDSLETKQNYSSWNYWYAHREMRDEKSAFFSTYYWAGAQKITYKLRAETPGTFHVMPARAYLMYTQEVGGNSDEMVMNISEKEGKTLSSSTPVPITAQEINPQKTRKPGLPQDKGNKSSNLGPILVGSVVGVSAIVAFIFLRVSAVK